VNQNVIRIFLFLSQNAPDILAQLEELIEFINELRRRFDGATTLASMADDQVEILREAYPSIAIACQTGEVSTASLNFRELIRFVIDNYSEIVALIELIKKLIGEK
jgi:DNA-binding FadR family transcriptional regulator